MLKLNDPKTKNTVKLVAQTLLYALYLLAGWAAWVMGALAWGWIIFVVIYGFLLILAVGLAVPPKAWLRWLPVQIAVYAVCVVCQKPDWSWVSILGTAMFKVLDHSDWLAGVFASVELLLIELIGVCIRYGLGGSSE